RRVHAEDRHGLDEPRRQEARLATHVHGQVGRRRDGDAVRRLVRGRGMSLVEVTVSAAVGLVVLGMGATLSSRAQKDSNSSYIRMGLKVHSTESTDLMVRELQLA